MSSGQNVVRVLSDDGAWCWFQDPRAVHVPGDFVRTVAGWVTHDGKLQVGAYNHEDQSTSIVTVADDWGVDDHNTCSILVLPDKRLMIFYAKHNGTGLYCRTSDYAGDIGSWGREVTITDSNRVTYSHPVYLSEEGTYYVFWRGTDWKPAFAISDDGIEWSQQRALLGSDPSDRGRTRPYMKVVSDNRSTIHFTFTDGHPRNEPANSVYYLRFTRGQYMSANGTVVGSLDGAPVDAVRLGRVYDAIATGARAWVWDIALDKFARPVIAYTRHPREDDHRYHYAAWDGQGWVDNQIVAAGPWFPQTRSGEQENEPHYSGGITFKHSDPRVIYLSRLMGGTFEIERWITLDMGESWERRPITEKSSSLNVRPVCPRGYEGTDDHILWMHGSYRHYSDFRTSIRGLFPAG